MIRTEHQARSQLGDLEHQLHQIVHESLAEFLEDHTTVRFKICHRTEANIVHDYMARAARRILGDNQRVWIIQRNGHAFMVCIDGRWALKLKKLDDELKGSNIPTYAALSFINQNGQRLIPDAAVASPTALILGYQRRELDLLESPVFLVCPDGDSTAWDWQLRPAAESSAPLPTEDELAAPAGTPASRVRPRAQRPVESDDVADEDQESGAG